MTLNTYLTFESNCREAFEFYREVFGGDLLDLTTFAEEIGRASCRERV